MLGEHVFSRRIPRHARHRASDAHEPIENGALHAAIVGNHLETGSRGLGQGEPHAIGHIVGGVRIGAFARHRGGKVLPHDALARTHFRQQAFRIIIYGGDDRALGTMIAHVAHERARVHALDGHHAVALQVFAKRHIAAPIARRCAHIAHHQPSQCGLARLRVLEVHAVVADLRIRQRDDLACIAGVADHLEIPLKRGVEAYLAKSLPRGTARGAEEHRAIF